MRKPTLETLEWIFRLKQIKLREISNHMISIEEKQNLIKGFHMIKKNGNRLDNV